ncbi:hypothetical protein LTR70_007926 [Exophiala xenobiotica]|nr:hypothetical protein LTR70_007926 [Exophiala xenobiotica]
MEVAVLPEEILSLICAELGREREFKCLYNCARSSRSLADAALRTMYQYHELSPAFNFTEDNVQQKDDTFERKQQLSQQYFRRWTILWRSIVSSSLEVTPTTYKPYCRYLRIIDFRNLSEMLESTHFRAAKRSFYAKPLSRFNHVRRQGKWEMVDTVATINDVGETVIPKAMLLEEISGHLRPGFWTRWIAQTPRLKQMVLWKGDALGSEAGKAVASNCEYFDALTVHGWINPDADEVFAAFLNDLNPDTLRYLHFISFNSICQRSFEALGRHSTIKELILNDLNREAMENLSALKCCTQIRLLSLEDSSRNVRLEESHNDVYVEVIAWLSSCTRLRDITIKNFFDGPSILAAVAGAPDVKWAKLCLEGYTVRNANSASFHTALPDQKYLESLFLSGSGDDTHSHDLEIMVSSICQLSNLKELFLKQVSDEFDMTHITNLALNLPLLEEFWTSGGELSADILPLLANLRHLKSLTLNALTQFDLSSILDFVQRLDPETQKGFSLSLLAVDMDFSLSEQELQLVTESIKTQVGGHFDYAPWREAESENSDDD